MKEYYKDLNTQINQLLEKLSIILTDKEVKEVVEFIDAAEYGLALETLFAILVEEKKMLNIDVWIEIESIARKMGIFDEKRFNRNLLVIK
ncbi:MAG: hypothetical protein K0R63_1329 [Rickettsiales bacterium]|jgi:hypothetical protein|nr:hypothetical protein [Rickettsiales bacterium]